MSCNKSAPGDYELSEVIEAAQCDPLGMTEEDGEIIIDGPEVSLNVSRLEGSDRVEVWNIDSDSAALCTAFLDRLQAITS